jgi:hypothetical protein
MAFSPPGVFYAGGIGVSQVSGWFLSISLLYTPIFKKKKKKLIYKNVLA